jgi:hypothetical protein
MTSLRGSSGVFEGGVRWRNVPVHSGSRPRSISSLLLGVVRRWYHHSLLRSVLLELRSSLHRIQLLRRFRGCLNLQMVRQSIPQVPCSGSRNEMQFCTAGIQSLQEARPYLTIADVELFCQGWFLAEKWFHHSMGSESRSGVSGSRSPAGADYTPPTVSNSVIAHT